MLCEYKPKPSSSIINRTLVEWVDKVRNQVRIDPVYDTKSSSWMGLIYRDELDILTRANSLIWDYEL